MKHNVNVLFQVLKLKNKRITFINVTSRKLSGKLKIKIEKNPKAYGSVTAGHGLQNDTKLSSKNIAMREYHEYI